MTSVKICSININGMNSVRKQDYIVKFMREYHIDILCVQETHIDTKLKSKRFEDKYLLGNRCIWSYGSNFSRGVCVIFNNNDIDVKQFHADFQGRLVYVDFALHNETNYRLVNVYCPTCPGERVEYCNSILPHLVTVNHLIIAGDFNFVFDCSLDKIGGDPSSKNIGSKEFKLLLDKFKLVDVFRHLYPHRRDVTWFGACRHKSRMVGCRLDRVYFPSVLRDDILSVKHEPCPYSDHDFVTFEFNINKDISFGKSYWKFNNSLLDIEDFVSAFKFYWQIISRTERLTLDWWDEMKLKIKEFCIDFSKSNNRAHFEEYKRIKRMYLETSDLGLKSELKSKLLSLEARFFKGSVIRSKAHSIDSNENPTAYFFNLEQEKGSKKVIHCIEDEHGVHRKTENILSSFRDFYIQLFSEEPVDDFFNDYFFEGLPKVEESECPQLDSIITREEVFHALKKMDPSKSPGSDGLTPAFYLKFFDLFGDMLTYIYNLGFQTGKLSESQRLSYITLICKDPSNSTERKNYRPISLLNVDRKVLSKVLATRLGSVLPSIIGIGQTCAIKGRSIFDNIHLMRNVLDYVEQKNIGAAFVSLDQEKAFDRVSWSYMFSALQAFGFGENFIKWVKLLYNDVSSAVIVNNHMSTPFQLGRGVRQGCPLSPLLYVLCFEPFAHKVQNDPDIEGIVVPGGKFHLKMSIYADDNTGFFTSDQSIRKFFLLVTLFQDVSGSKVNYKKSSGMFVGKWKNRSDHPFGISWVERSKILGYFYGQGIDDDFIWSKHFNKLNNTLNLWRSRSLSFKGKSTVLNSVCLSKIIYFSTCSLLPKHYLVLFQRSMFRFVWGSAFEPLSRKTLHLPFHEGGLNIPNIELKVKSLYLVHLSKLMSRHNAVWTYFARYWLDIPLRKYKKGVFDNTCPHSEYVPPFYNACLDVLNKFASDNKTVDFSLPFKSCQFYRFLLSADAYKPKCVRVHPHINFKNVFKCINSSAVDPHVRSTCYRLVHDVLYVNMYLFNRSIGKCNKCMFCDKAESLRHLFLECSLVLPLNKTVLFLLQIVSGERAYLTERHFRFFDVANVSGTVKYIFLIYLSESRYTIWHFRNRVKYDNNVVTALSLIQHFVSRIKYRIYADFMRFSPEKFNVVWVVHGIADVDNDNLLYSDFLSVDMLKRRFHL